MPFAQATRSLGQAGLFAFAVLRASRPTADFRRELVREIYKLGARSLPIIAAGGAFVGLSVTLLGYRALETYGATSQVSTLLGLGLYRELGPVLTALGLMAIDPVAKAVAPRFWAAVVCVPLLTAFFCSLAITAGWFQAVHVIGVDAGTFWQVMRESVDFADDFLVAFVKAAVFGATTALTAAYVGYHAEPTIEGTSIATTRAVVNGSLLVLMFNFVLSALLFR
jgi:phospholipid/cholesterol/gamma-HCH transport system permease protein